MVTTPILSYSKGPRRRISAPTAITSRKFSGHCIDPSPSIWFDRMSSQNSDHSIATPSSFKNRTVIVSGGTGKLGRVICQALAVASANVVINDINVTAVNELVSELTAAKRDVVGTTLSAATSASQIVALALEKYGRIDAIITPTLGAIPWKPLENLTDDDFRAAFEANVLAPISLIKAAWPHFKEQNFGRVVNFTSDSLLGFPTASTYTLSKGALFGVNKTLAIEGASHNIKVNCVSPIAYVPSMERHIMRFSEEIQEAFKTQYLPEANVPVILALCTEQCEATGQVFNTAGWAAGRNVWGCKAGVKEMRTVEQALEGLKEITGATDEVFEPQTMVDFTEWQSKYVLG